MLVFVRLDEGDETVRGRVMRRDWGVACQITLDHLSQLLSKFHSAETYDV